MSGMLPGVEVARRRRASHHHQIVSKPSTRRMDPDAFCPLGATAGESSLDENTLKAKRNLEEKLWNRKPNCKRGWSTFFCQRNRPPADEPPPETSRKEPIPSTTLENFRSAILSSQVGAGRDLCSACLDGFHLQQSVIRLPCFHGRIRSASALS
ncbi:uncharacterized protein LOC116259134 [Nymphaea colorata]|nr:uncharacterized protein LOC116259134 [Nymphaea colorata]